MPGYKTKRQRLEARHKALVAERQSFDAQYKELSEFILPNRTEFPGEDQDPGRRLTDSIIDSTGTYAANTLEAGMMSGVTSSSRPWKRTTTPYRELNELQSVKLFNNDVDKEMDAIMAGSNLYQSLATLYLDYGTFGTPALYIEEDLDTVLHTEIFPVGSFYIACDRKGRVNTLSRPFRMTVENLVARFGRFNAKGEIVDWSNISTRVKDLWDQDKLDEKVDVIHFIGPNPDYNPKRLESKYLRFESCYFEASVGHDGDKDKYLEEKGYEYFPVLVPRWKTTGRCPYATSCPGMVVLGDVKQLQFQEKQAATAIEKIVNPPMVAHPNLAGTTLTVLPGEVTYGAEGDGESFKPAYQVNLRINELEMKSEQIRTRIKRGYFADLFLGLTTDPRGDKTAFEIAEQIKERLLALGPVLDRLNEDLLNPLIEIIFSFMVRQRRIPKPPQELEGVPLKVEYISILAQAQKAVALGGIERLAQYVGSLAQMTGDPSVFDKFDTDQSIDEEAEALGVSPRIVRPDDAVAEIRARRQQAQAQATQAEQMKQATSAVKDLSQADTSGQNALTDLLQAQQGEA